MTLAFYSHPDCRAHFMGRGHPECPERLDAIRDHLIATGLMDALDVREPPLATAEQLARAHTSLHVDELQAAMAPLAQSGEHVQIDPDTSAGPGTWQAALRAAGVSGVLMLAPTTMLGISPATPLTPLASVPPT